jgi:hypothetical protein
VRDVAELSELDLEFTQTLIVAEPTEHGKFGIRNVGMECSLIWVIEAVQERGFMGFLVTLTLLCCWRGIFE